MPPTPEHLRLQTVVHAHVEQTSGLVVLDAGCGSRAQFIWPDDTTVWGLDVSQEQLDARDDLAEKLLGSVEDYPLPAATFDAVVCWNVLEHVDDPVRALGNFAQSLKPGGIVVLAHPHPYGLKSLVAKLTPFWVHELFWQRVMPWVVGGARGHGCPFPTRMRWSLAPERLTAAARARGLVVEHLEVYEARTQLRLRAKLRLTGQLWSAVCAAWRLLSLGHARADQTEVMLLLRHGT